MIHISSIASVAHDTDAGRQIAQLRHMLGLVEEIAGMPPQGADALDEVTRIGTAYEAAPPIVQRRFDAFAAETADWAAAAVEVLIASGNPAQRSSAAARRLAEELARAIARLSRMVA